VSDRAPLAPAGDAGTAPGAPAAAVAGTAPGALAAAVADVGDRWSLLVVEALLAGPHRFGDLQVAVEGIATNVLTQRLRHLEQAGVVLARTYSQRPRRSAYELTAAGRELAGALRLLAGWGAARTGEAAGGPSHAVCGTGLEVRWWCPTCERPVEDPDEAPYLA